MQAAKTRRMMARARVKSEENNEDRTMTMQRKTMVTIQKKRCRRGTERIKE
jgi:hypothetical protein